MADVTLTEEEREVLLPVLRKNVGAYSAVESIVAARVAAALGEVEAQLAVLADEVEWKFRSMSFYCGSGESETRLHPAGAFIRKQLTRTMRELRGEVSS